MDFQSQIERLKYIDYLINSKTACSVEKLAEKLSISPRQVKNNIRLMKGLGAPIKYNKYTGYYLVGNKKLILRYE
jgi:biotin operon repressor